MRVILCFLLVLLLSGCETVWFDKETRDTINLLGTAAAEYNKQPTTQTVSKPLELECRERGSRFICTDRNSSVELECRKRGDRIVCAE